MLQSNLKKQPEQSDEQMADCYRSQLRPGQKKLRFSGKKSKNIRHNRELASAISFLAPSNPAKSGKALGGVILPE
jgi:hypothetical protein